MLDVKENSVGNNLSFVGRFRDTVPASVRLVTSVLRFDRPTGIWLLLLPCWWSMSLGLRSLDTNLQQGLSDPVDGVAITTIAALFAVGAVLMRGAGCIINDIFDRNIDRCVDRTRGRPLACGALSLTSAVVCVGSVMLAGFFVLLQFNLVTILIALISVPMFVIYPLMKRVTYWPQAWLGLTFNWGALLGWTAVTGILDLPAIVLYAGCFFWILGYDTLYAHQDREDDIAVQVRSSAIFLGQKTVPAVAAFYALSFLLLLVSGLMVDMHWLFYFLMSLPACHLVWQVLRINIHDKRMCWALFVSNRTFGLLVLLAFVAGHADTFLNQLGLLKP